MKRFKTKLSVCILSGALIFTPISLSMDSNTIISEAHSGRTDGSGGHKDNKNKSGLGSYHYHCGGYPAHLHTNGVCPYSSSSASTDTTSTSTANSNVTVTSTSATLSISGKSMKLSTGESVSLSKDLIKILQDVLNQKGYECGTADGVIGMKTKTAIEEFLDDNKDKGDTDYLIIGMIADALDIE